MGRGCRQGHRHEGSREAQMSASAAPARRSGALRVIPLRVILYFYSLDRILSHVRVECYNISITVMHTCGKACISWVGAKLLVGVQVACLRIGSMDWLRTA